MKVRVKRDCVGFFGGIYRRAGQVFELDNEKQLSNKWMEVIEKPKAKPGPKPKVAEVE